MSGAMTLQVGRRHDATSTAATLDRRAARAGAAAAQIDPGDPDQPADDVQDRQGDQDDRGLRRRARSSPAGRRPRGPASPSRPTRSRRSPGKSPNTTTSAASGASVRISVGVMSVRWWPRPLQELGQLAEHDPLVHPEQVAPRRGSCTNVATAATHGAYSNAPTRTRNSPTKPDSPGSPPEAKTKKPKIDGPDRHHRGDAAHLRDRPVVGPLVDHPDEQEQGARDQAVVDHLEDRPVHALLVEDEDPERDEAHVRHGAVRDELLQVGLDEGHDRAVDDRDQAQDDDRRAERVGRRREQRQGEADEPVRRRASA